MYRKERTPSQVKRRGTLVLEYQCRRRTWSRVELDNVEDGPVEGLVHQQDVVQSLLPG